MRDGRDDGEGGEGMTATAAGDRMTPSPQLGRCRERVFVVSLAVGEGGHVISPDVAW